jgi:hypothetical protein
LTGPADDDRRPISEVFDAESPLGSADGGGPDADERDQWLRENVPPHHI